jgi:O-succinylhomoserine sulfhydrylase
MLCAVFRANGRTLNWIKIAKTINSTKVKSMDKQTSNQDSRRRTPTNTLHPYFWPGSFCFDDAKNKVGHCDKSEETSRFSDPSVQEFIDKVCMLENAEDGVMTATGMSRDICGFAAHCSSDAVSSNALFGSANQSTYKYSFPLGNHLYVHWRTAFPFLNGKSSKANH